jgi:hypothetical protein
MKGIPPDYNLILEFSPLQNEILQENKSSGPAYHRYSLFTLNFSLINLDKVTKLNL